MAKGSYRASSVSDMMLTSIDEKLKIYRGLCRIPAEDSFLRGISYYDLPLARPIIQFSEGMLLITLTIVTNACDFLTAGLSEI